MHFGALVEESFCQARDLSSSFVLAKFKVIKKKIKMSLLINFLVISLLIAGSTHASGHRANESKRTPVTNWSVELSQVTTLPPPNKLLPDNGPINYHQSQSQEGLFDDSREPISLTPTRSSSGTFSHGPLSAENHHFGYNQAPVFQFDNNSTRWTPTEISGANDEMNLNDKLRIMSDVPRIETREAPDSIGMSGAHSIGPLFSPMTQQSYITLDSLTKYLKKREPHLKSSYDFPAINSLPGNTLVSKDLIQRAMAIRDSLVALDHANNHLQLLTTSAPKRPNRGFKIFTGRGQSSHNEWNNHSNDANNKPIHRASKVRDELFVDTIDRVNKFNYLTDRMGSQTSSDNNIAGLKDHLVPYSTLPFYYVSSPAEVRSSKLEDDHQSTLSDSIFANGRYPATSPAASHHLPVYYGASYPATMAHKGGMAARHEKALLTPILVGIVAALISFLVISNLFLSIPLFAITLWQLFNGGGMMLMPNNNQNMMPNNMPNTNPNQSGQPTNGKRRRRRDLDDLQSNERMILNAIGKMTKYYTT